jgi:hypothetical protein
VANLIELAADPHDQPFVGQQAFDFFFCHRRRRRMRRSANKQAGKQGPAKHGREFTAIKLRSQMKKTV